MNVAIIFAGGIGSRMRSRIGPKQYMPVQGKPIIIYTLERFDSHEEIDAIFVVAAKTKVSTVKNLVQEHGIKKVVEVVAGGASAHESVVNGLFAIKKHGVADSDIVLVHDGVRPIISGELISKNIHSAKSHGNAITSLPAFETAAHSSDGLNIDTIPKRNEMYTLQAPQTFTFGEAFELNCRAIDDNLLGEFVDQAELNQHYGRGLFLVSGSRGNAKITVPLDLLYFEFLVTSGKYNEIINDEIVW
jgi:2-C-methyl-D-erythritol 4-phosphate cytidylyltransferase